VKDVASVEKVLNSRCSSGFGPGKSHFGTFIDESNVFSAEETSELNRLGIANAATAVLI
jgi:hypothetical protein